MTKCANCAHSVFDETWGEYKCRMLKKKITGSTNTYIRCKNFKKDPEKVKAANIAKK